MTFMTGENRDKTDPKKEKKTYKNRKEKKNDINWKWVSASDHQS